MIQKMTSLATALLFAAITAVSSTQAISQTQPTAVVTSKSHRPADLSEANNRDWDTLATGVCKVTPPATKPSDECAQQAIVLVSDVCSRSAANFNKESKLWKSTAFALTLASAAFTGVGASTTISSAKVWSTLGGTTGLGAVTSTVNSNVSSDQAGLASVNSALIAFQKFIQTGGADGKSAPDAGTIYKNAPIYAAQCLAAASASSK